MDSRSLYPDSFVCHGKLICCGIVFCKKLPIITNVENFSLFTYFLLFAKGTFASSGFSYTKMGSSIPWVSPFLISDSIGSYSFSTMVPLCFALMYELLEFTLVLDF